MKHIPTPIEGTYRKSALKVPETIYRCSGIVVFGKRIWSFPRTWPSLKIPMPTPSSPSIPSRPSR